MVKKHNIKHINKEKLKALRNILLDFRQWKSRDLVGYEKLIDFIDERELFKLEGDFVEIGALFGGGTVKLAEYARMHNKNVYAVDVFDPHVDKSYNHEGFKMSTQYQLRRLLLGGLKNKTQYEIFRDTTKNQDNIIVKREDSLKIRFSPEHKFIFCFIDGNHTPKYVINDFYKVWNNVVPGGAVGFHDYGGDIPHVTETIDDLIEKHRDEIRGTEQFEDTIFLTKS